MSRKKLTRRTRLIPALGLAAALALPGAALAQPARQVGAVPWGPLWSWLVSWVTGVGGPGVPAPPAAGPLAGSWEKAGATLEPDGVRRTLLETSPTAPAPSPTPTETGTGATSF
jgi:hypothetical protein